MTAATLKRLENIESKAGIGEDTYKVEHYNISPSGKLVRMPDADGQLDDRPAARIIQVISCDGDGNGGPGPCYSAYLRCQAAEGKGANEAF
jgi:hypothetical protein